jgi:hypothetical protein
MYRKYINIVEAADKGCPIATHDVNDSCTGVFVYRTFGTATGDVYVEISV